MAYFYLFWTQNVEHGWKAMSLGIITMTLSIPKILIKKFQIRFQNLSMFLDGIGMGFKKIGINICFKKIWNKKYQIQFQKFWYQKSIAFGIEKIWYWTKVFDSVSLRFWVLSNTDTAFYH